MVFHGAYVNFQSNLSSSNFDTVLSFTFTFFHVFAVGFPLFWFSMSVLLHLIINLVFKVGKYLPFLCLSAFSWLFSFSPLFPTYICSLSLCWVFVDSIAKRQLSPIGLRPMIFLRKVDTRPLCSPFEISFGFRGQLTTFSSL